MLTCLAPSLPKTQLPGQQRWPRSRVRGQRLASPEQAPQLRRGFSPCDQPGMSFPTPVLALSRPHTGVSCCSPPLPASGGVSWGRVLGACLPLSSIRSVQTCRTELLTFAPLFVAAAAAVRRLHRLKASGGGVEWKETRRGGPGASAASRLLAPSSTGAADRHNASKRVCLTAEDPE